MRVSSEAMLVDSVLPGATLRVHSTISDGIAGWWLGQYRSCVAGAASDKNCAQNVSVTNAFQRSSTPSLLCVEDDSSSVAQLAEGLSHSSYVVDFALDGEIGLARIRAHRPDLVVCSMAMPGIGGLDLLRKVQEEGPAFANIPFIFLVWQYDRDSELACRKLGADDYLCKPIDLEMLGVVVENRLRRTIGLKPSRIPADLTPREKEVLTWVGRGKTSAEIATILGLSERTVNFHCNQAMIRLDVINRTQAAVKALSQGLISV
jgi:DNA-binding NarL/FixJ family response regulator